MCFRSKIAILALALAGCAPKGAAMKPQVNQPVVLEGIARDAKAGAMVIVDSQPYYVAGLDAWPRELDGARVRVAGTLREEKMIPDPVGPNGELRQGAKGTQLVVRDATLAKL